MAKTGVLRCAVIALSVAFVTSTIMVFMMPSVNAALWTQTTDTDFNQALVKKDIEIVGSGPAAYVQLIKNTSSWFDKNPASPPSARAGHSMVWDTVNSRALLFGGLDAMSNYLNDTWAYYPGNNTWIQIQANAPPAGRYYAGMAFDSTNGVAVLYGGYDIIGANTETWEYNAFTGSWTNTTPLTSPVDLASTPLAYDSTAGMVILAGLGIFGWETWAYNVVTNIWTPMTGTNPPGDRAGHRLVFYPEIGRTLLFGGSFGMTIFDETWEYDYVADTWYDYTGNTGGNSPGSRSSYNFVYRPDKADIVLWGGLSTSGYPVDTWQYLASGGAGGTRTWSQLLTGSNPTSRRNHGMAYDSGNSTVALFGGQNPSGTALNDTWALELGYVSIGWIASSVFDSGYSNTQWNYLFWNQTPAAVPPNTQIRFQARTGNDPDPSTWGSFRGPDGTVSTYYTLPPEALWVGLTPARYIQYYAQLFCTGCTDSAHIEDVSIDYYSPPVPPTVVSRYPFNGALNVPLDSNIYINFSEPMDTAQVTVELTGFVLGYNWFDSDTRLVLTHAVLFDICTQYRPSITQAVDKQGQSMGGLPDEWVFVTVCPEPEIKETNPQHDDTGIPLTAPIYVNFTKPMNETTIVVNITPPISGLSNLWANNSSDLRVDHVEDFTECEWYTVNVTGKDKWNKSLSPGVVPNPWFFRANCTYPRVIITDPYDGEYEVELDRPVEITFSHEMDPATVQLTLNPAIILTPSWNTPLNTVVTYNHPPNFAPCTLYTANVTGKDILGKDLIDGYYEWTFFTTCGGSPYIVATFPEDGAIDVPEDQDVVISFSEAMVTSSLVFTVEPSWFYNLSWSPSNDIMFLSHKDADLFITCTKYYINVTDGIDINEGKSLVLGPVPNRFTFITTCPNPFVSNIDPADGATGVPNDKNITVVFTKSMDTANFNYTLEPTISLKETWTDLDTVLHLDHGPLFQDGTKYFLNITDAQDTSGNSMIGDRSFNFTTFLPGVNPWIVLTDPYDGETGVQVTRIINITFSESINPSTLIVTIMPSISLSPQWFDDYKIVELTHPPFTQSTTYNVTVQACDFDGDCLVPGPEPNPWEFTTESVNPFIVSTDPVHDETGVEVTRDIEVNFNKPMNRASVTYVLIPNIPPTLNKVWSNGDQTLTLTHNAGEWFAMSTQYSVFITGTDTSGNPLISGPVLNPWNFTTVVAPGAPTGLEVHRQGNDILLTWNAPPNADGYRVFEATDRFTPWPWSELANVTMTNHLAVNHNNDGLTHFYIVRAYNSTSWLEGGNSTMGVKAHLTFTYNPTTSNTHWFSLPYNTIYSKASDIANELGPTKTTVIAKWDTAKQKSLLYYYTRGRWRGQDFSIIRGDGLWLAAASTFSWNINGTDTSQLMMFNPNPPSKTNYFWISLPYTNSYQNAAAISTELTNIRIIEIGRYNPTTGAIEVWYWTGSIWTGTNFPILPGEGFYIKIVTMFSWTPKLITQEVP